MISLTAILSIGSLNMAAAQDQPKPKKDTVNIDTDAKPTFYYAVEDEASQAKGSSATMVIIAGAVVVVALGGFILLRKKKK